MSLRRPRVKASANLLPKRKIKKECEENNTNATVKIETIKESIEKHSKLEAKLPQSQAEEIESKTEYLNVAKLQSNDVKRAITEKEEQTIPINHINSEIKNNSVKLLNTTNNKINANFKCPASHSAKSPELLNTSDTSIINDLKNSPHNSEFSNTLEVPMVTDFKCPPNVEKKEKLIPQNSTITDLTQYYDTSQQQQQQNMNISNSSPIKHRQRIRPMPFFGLRRNSIQGSNTDSEDESRRYHKINTPTAIHSPMILEHKMNSFNNNRKRTESTCSNVSESGRADRSRKVYITEENQRMATAKKEFNTKFDGGIPDKSILKVFHFIHYNPITNPMKQMQKNKTEDDNKSITKDPQITTTDDCKSEKSDNCKEPTEKQDDSSSILVPQLKLGANGELVLDEASLVIETTAEKEAREKLANSNVIYVDENSENNGFYKRQKRTRDWSAEETIKFYRCLHTVGTDFSLMLTLFPNRNRRDLKLKFKKEEKHNLALINKALLYPKTFDIEELKLELDKEEKEAAEKQKKWEEIKRKNQMQKNIIKDKKIKKSRCERALSHGDIVYDNENLITAPCRRKKQPLISKITEYHNISNTGFQVTTLNNEDYTEDNEPDHAVTEQNLFDALVDTEDCQDEVANVHDVKTVNSDIEKDTIKQDIKNDFSTVNEPNIKPKEFQQESKKLEKGELKTSKLENKYLSNVENVLREIANGSLVAVSSEDPENPDKIIHEIFVVCKESGELSEEPLDLSDDVMQCIISAISL